MNATEATITEQLATRGLSVRRVARILNTRRTATVYDWINRGRGGVRLQAGRIGRGWRVLPEWLDTFTMAPRQPDATDPNPRTLPTDVAHERAIADIDAMLKTKSPRPGAGNGHAAVCAAQRDISTSRAGRVFSPPTCHARRGAGVNAAAGASAASAGRVSITEKP